MDSCARFVLNRILNLTDITLSSFAYSNLTTVFISHHFHFSSHTHNIHDIAKEHNKNFQANRWSWRPYLFILGFFLQYILFSKTSYYFPFFLFCKYFFFFFLVFILLWSFFLSFFFFSLSSTPITVLPERVVVGF